MLRWPFILGAVLFVGGSVIAFLVLFSRIPGFPDASLVWFIFGVVMAAIGYLIVVLENYLRYRVDLSQFNK